MVKEFKGNNEWAIILGGSSGLGLATAKKLAAHGLNLCLVYRARRVDLPNIEIEFQEILNSSEVKLIQYNLDAVNPVKRAHVLSELQTHFTAQDKVKVLIHSIAKGNLKPMVSQDAASLKNDDFRITIETMGTSLYDWVKDVHSIGLFAEDARVLSFTSEGNSKAWQNYAAVSAAKAVLEAITRNIALEFAPHGIRANCIQAGVTDTFSLNLIPNSDLLKKKAIERNPYGRLTQAEEVADAVYLLCKEEAAWINGAVIPVNGGEHLR